MTGEVQKAEGIMILVAGALALYAVYSVYKTGSDTASKVTKSVSDIVQSATDTLSGAKRSIENSYAEVSTFVTGNQHYSPSALDASLSRADAIKLADEIAARDAAKAKAPEKINEISSVTYDEMGNVINTDYTP